MRDASVTRNAGERRCGGGIADVGGDVAGRGRPSRRTKAGPQAKIVAGILGKRCLVWKAERDSFGAEIRPGGARTLLRRLGPFGPPSTALHALWDSQTIVAGGEVGRAVIREHRRAVGQPYALQEVPVDQAAGAQDAKPLFGDAGAHGACGRQTMRQRARRLAVSSTQGTVTR